MKVIILHNDRKPFYISKEKKDCFHLETAEFFPSKFTFMNFFFFFFTHQYLFGPYIPMTALLFPIFYTHRIFMVLLFLESPSLWIQRDFIITS